MKSTTDTKTTTDTTTYVDLEDCLTLEDCFGCDPWDEENLGKHPASREPDPRRIVRGGAW